MGAKISPGPKKLEETIVIADTGKKLSRKWSTKYNRYV